MTTWLRASGAGSRMIGTRPLLRPLKNSLIGWWTFEGNQALDMSGNGSNGIRGSTAAFGPSPYGQANYHSGAGNSGFTVPTTSALLTVPFTWSMFVYQGTIATTGLLGATFNGTAGGLLSITGALRLQGSVAISSTARMVAGVWYHVAVSATGSACALYLNGLQVAAGANTVTPPVTLLALGTTTGITNATNYADVRFFNRSLSAEEIYAIYANSVNPVASFPLPLALAGPIGIPIVGAASALAAARPVETISVFI